MKGYNKCPDCGKIKLAFKDTCTPCKMTKYAKEKANGPNPDCHCWIDVYGEMQKVAAGCPLHDQKAKIGKTTYYCVRCPAGATTVVPLLGAWCDPCAHKYQHGEQNKSASSWTSPGNPSVKVFSNAAGGFTVADHETGDSKSFLSMDDANNYMIAITTPPSKAYPGSVEHMTGTAAFKAADLVSFKLEEGKYKQSWPAERKFGKLRFHKCYTAMTESWVIEDDAKGELLMSFRAPFPCEDDICLTLCALNAARSS